jgi:tetratricopeptide (TPR) repeat protein
MAASERLGNSQLERLFLQTEFAAALDAAGRHVEALAQYDRLVEETRELLGPRSQRVGMLHNNRGLARYYVRDLTGAIEDLRLSLEIETALGVSEATCAPTRLNLALALAATGALEDAVPLLEQVRAVWKSQPGAVAEDALVTKALAWVELRRGRLERAANLAAAALASAREALDADHPEIAASATLLGDVALAQGAIDDALEQFAVAERIWAKPANVRDPSRIDTLDSQAEAWLRLGKFDEALAGAEAALELAATVEVDDGSRARAHFVRARVRETRGDHPGALDDARIARGLLQGPLLAPERAELEAWLARR